LISLKIERAASHDLDDGCSTFLIPRYSVDSVDSAATVIMPSATMISTRGDALGSMTARS